MSDEPHRMAPLDTRLNAFQVMQQASNKLEREMRVKQEGVTSTCDNDQDYSESDPIYIAVVYRRRLIHIPESEPLYGIVYGGQAVRSADEYDEPIDVARARWNEENNQAKREEKKVGLPAALRIFGEDAFEDDIVHYMIGRVSVVQPWADQLEKNVITDNGGVLQSMHERLKQTLNLTEGGKGYQIFLSQVARRNECFQRFKQEMESYVEDFKTSLVPINYVNPKTGYKVGRQLASFRQGAFRNGMPSKIEIDAWAESLPEWAWNGTKTAEYAFKRKVNAQNQWARMSEFDRKSKLDANSELNRRKQSERLSKLKEDEREHALKWIGYREKGSQVKKADLDTLRKIDPFASRKDLPKARLEGSIPRRNCSEAKIATSDKKNKMIIDSLPESEREKKALAIARRRRATLQSKSDLELLRTMKPNAKQSDIAQARIDGLLPKSQRGKKRKDFQDTQAFLDGLPIVSRNSKKKRKKRVTTTTTTTTVTEYKTESESSDEEEYIEAILGSSSSAPLPKRRRRDDSDSD